MHIATSVNGVPIRLTAERWLHIIEARDEIAGRLPEILETIESPDWVVMGYNGALVAWKSFGKSRWLAVVYKEIKRTDGYVVTAFFATKPKRRNRVWP